MDTPPTLVKGSLTNMFGFVKKTKFEAEVKRNEVLSKRLEEKESLILRIQRELEDINSRYFEVTASEQYKQLQDYESLKVELAKLKPQVEEEIRVVHELKNVEIAKARTELDEHITRMRREEEKSSEVIKVGFSEKIDLLKVELKRVEVALSEKLQVASALADEIEIKRQELKDADLQIEVKDELATVTQMSQDITGVNSFEIKIKIEKNKDEQKELIKKGKAWDAYECYHLNGSLSAGKAQQKRLGKFLLTAFNAQVDNIISSAKKGNFHRCHVQIEKWFEKVNELGHDHHVVIERQYLKLRLEELRVVAEYHLQKEFEKEEERYINESIREEKRVQKEIEDFVKAREKEEIGYKGEIEKITKELKAISEAEVDKLKFVISDLQLKLERSVKEKERALSLAQLTRSGHVYIISNERSFGRGVYKIGMTRRLEPMDRVKELGDASVPFFFDVHGIIHSEDAPGLERELHKRFDSHRVNKENYRREFFRVSIEEIERVVCEIHGQISLDRLTRNEELEEGSFQDEDW